MGQALGEPQVPGEEGPGCGVILFCLFLIVVFFIICL